MTAIGANRSIYALTIVAKNSRRTQMEKALPVRRGPVFITIDSRDGLAIRDVRANLCARAILCGPDVHATPCGLPSDHVCPSRAHISAVHWAGNIRAAIDESRVRKHSPHFERWMPRVRPVDRQASRSRHCRTGHRELFQRLKSSYAFHLPPSGMEGFSALAGELWLNES